MPLVGVSCAPGEPGPLQATTAMAPANTAAALVVRNWLRLLIVVGGRKFFTKIGLIAPEKPQQSIQNEYRA